MVKYLPDAGWEPVVLSVDPEDASYPDLDPAMMDDVSSGIHVERTTSWDPYAAYAHLMGKKKSDAVGVGFLGADHTSPKEKFARWVRANLFLPDARVGWVRHAVRAGRRLAKSPGFDAIVSTGPPHSAHLIGQRLATATGKPWIADLRDAWPDPAYQHMLPASDWALGRDERMRQRALGTSDARIAVTNDLAYHMGEATGHVFEVIRNGFDPADLARVREQPQLAWPTMEKARDILDDFLIVHTGNLSPARDPEPLWKALDKVKGSGAWSRLRLVFVGNVDPGIRETAASVLGDRVTYVPYVPHDEAIAWMLSSSLLLLPINRVMGSAGIVTGKIYEYLASGRPILALGEPHGEADGLLSESGAGSLFAYEDVAGLTSAIEHHYRAWEDGESTSGVSNDRLKAYSRKSQAASLAELLDRVVAS
jgi:glycosyltransferase involved in cell wall biosynthesis